MFSAVPLVALRRPAPVAQATHGHPAPHTEPLPPVTFTRAVERLDTLPGVKQRGAAMILAEIGIDMTRFGTASWLAAWSGVAPGNDERAGTQRSGKTRTRGTDRRRRCGGRGCAIMRLHRW